jgi:hypothetical protein
VTLHAALLSPIVQSVGSAVGGAVLSLLMTLAYERYRFRQEFQANNSIDVTGGDWHAAWQTSVNGQEILNTEKILIRQKGATVKMCNREKSRENPKGGYLWEAQLQFFHGRDMMGWYFPKKEENNASKGIFFLNYNSSQKMFIGKWVGASYDGPLTNGFVVISKERASSLETLKRILSAHPSKVGIIEASI